MKYKRVVYWFSHDLRLADNSALQALCKDAEQACFVYVFNQRDFEFNRFLSRGMGQHRYAFIVQCLADLKRQLAHLGHELLVFRGEPKTVLQQLLAQTQADALFHAKPFGYDERTWLTALNSQNPQVAMLSFSQFTLFDLQSEWQQASVFSSFSRFRKYIEQSQIAVKLDDKGLPNLAKVKPIAKVSLPSLLPEALLQQASVQSEYFDGGEGAAQTQLQGYFRSGAASTYKETRNALDGWLSSTKFSPYLAQGCLSAKQIWQAVKQYEQQVEANDSTYWIRFELLWREYFQWLSIRLGTVLFSFQGVRSTAPLTSFYGERLHKWQQGETPFPIVNACMKQLNQTGYMSNRGRQLVASCLVNELSLDWRFGAAYMQEKLIDYDVAVNWGNWQYLAGVGVDPRGGRHFNLEKQSQIYDPNRDFITRWQGESEPLALDSADIVDWPIEQAE